MAQDDTFSEIKELLTDEDIAREAKFILSYLKATLSLRNKNIDCTVDITNSKGYTSHEPRYVYPWGFSNILLNCPDVKCSGLEYFIQVFHPYIQIKKVAQEYGYTSTRGNYSTNTAGEKWIYASEDSLFVNFLRHWESERFSQIKFPQSLTISEAIRWWFLLYLIEQTVDSLPIINIEKALKGIVGKNGISKEFMMDFKRSFSSREGDVLNRLQPIEGQRLIYVLGKCELFSFDSDSLSFRCDGFHSLVIDPDMVSQMKQVLEINADTVKSAIISDYKKFIKEDSSNALPRANAISSLKASISVDEIHTIKSELLDSQEKKLLESEGLIKTLPNGNIIRAHGITLNIINQRHSELKSELEKYPETWWGRIIELNSDEQGDPEQIEFVTPSVQPPPRPVTEAKVTKEVKIEGGAIVSKDTILLGADKSSLQYGVIGKISEKKVLIDLNEPHTISIFGVQGSGKSYTLGVITEIAIEEIQNISTLPKPLASVIFHYSRDETYIPEFKSFIHPNRNQDDSRGLKNIYNANPMAIQNIKILVPSRKLEIRRKEYEGLEVESLLFRPQKLGVKEWELLLGAGGKQLYLKKITNIIEKLKDEDKLTIEHLKNEIRTSKLNESQKELSILRVELVEKFLDENVKPFEEYLLSGSITLLDIRDEMMGEEDASILLEMLLVSMGRIDKDKLLVIDEAHKYFGKTLENDIVDLIREMRHKRTRILIASQDPPSVNARVIELSDIIILHQMRSPEWLKHIQGKNIALKKLKSEDLSTLKRGEAYIWAEKSTTAEITKQPMKIKVRPRITEHGGTTKTAV